MPTASWLTGASGDWSSGTLWSTGTVPNAAAVDVVIDAAGLAGSYAVAIDSGADFLVQSLTLDADLPNSGLTDGGTLLAGGTVAIVVGVVALTGSLGAAALSIGSGGALQGNGVVSVGGTLADGGFIGLSGGNLTLVANAMTLDGGQLDAENGLLSLQVADFQNLSGSTLTDGNFEADGNGVLMLPPNAGITALQGADLFLLGSGTIAYVDSVTGGTTAIQAGLQTIDSLSAVQIVGGATFTVQEQLTLDGRIDIVNGLLAAPELTIDAGGLLFGVGTVETSNGLVNDGTIFSGTGIASSLGQAVGTLMVTGAVQGTGDLVAGVGVLELATGSAEGVTLAGGGTLRVDAPIAPGGTVFAGAITLSGVGRSAPGTIDLANVALAGLTETFAGGGAVTFASGSQVVAEIDLVGSFDAGNFTLGDDGAGGAELVVACFAAGTRIRTPDGEVAIETLVVGDLLRTVSGGAEKVVWVGHRRVRCDRHPDPSLVWPVRVLAGAFGAGVPGRDLWLSPDHATLSEGVLIPVKHLINGGSIAQVAVPAITYWHVELGHHGVILAEGLPAESYLDTGNRAMFVGGAAWLALHPDFLPRGWGDACAPLVTGGSEVARLRRRADAGICLRVMGRLIRPARSDGRRHSFLVPNYAGSFEVELTPGLRIESMFLASGDVVEIVTRHGPEGQMFLVLFFRKRTTLPSIPRPSSATRPSAAG